MNNKHLLQPLSDLCQSNHRLGLDNAHLCAYTVIVKRLEFVKLLESDGWSFSRQGKFHDIYRKGDKQESVPRHKEINDNLVKAILSRNNIQKRKTRIKELK